MFSVTGETVRKILQVAEEDRKRDEDFKRVEIGRRLLFTRHCGLRMVQVKVFCHDPFAGKTAEKRVRDDFVCPECLFRYEHTNIGWAYH